MKRLIYLVSEELVSFMKTRFTKVRWLQSAISALDVQAARLLLDLTSVGEELRSPLHQQKACNPFLHYQNRHYFFRQELRTIWLR